MGAVLSAVASALSAVASYYKFVFPVREMRSIQREIHEYEDEIHILGNRGTPADKLRIEVVARRKRDAEEQLRTLRSAYPDPDKG
tara:strand:+ start:851 stop:1105 length:255 start_codon:yes stop_codon:yes gene_type:complete